MEERFQHTIDGLEVEEDDVNLWCKNGSLMDDRVLSEELRLTPFGGGAYAKAVMPYGQQAAAYDGACCVVPTGSANGSVNVMPFRAIVGSRSTIATFVAAGESASQAAADNWRDMRSGVFANSTSGTTLPYLLGPFANNASGFGRWDLVYATMAVEVAGASVTRYTKAPSTGVVTSGAVVRSLVNSVTVSVLTGTASATPAYPATPIDSGGNFIFPLAYVYIPNGFTSGSTVDSRNVQDAAPVAIKARTNGTANCAPANGSNTVGGAILTANPWAALAQPARTAAFLPPTMVGMESVFFVSDYARAGNAYVNGAVIDNSRDWRNRAFLVMASAQNGGYGAFDRISPSFTRTPGMGVGGGTVNQPVWSAANSAVQDAALVASSSTIAWWAPTAGATGNSPLALTSMIAASALGVYVDSTGNLKMFVNATGSGVVLFVWIFATAPFANY